ncbi:TolC family protein [Aquisphaera insulae]|uniref:TolC family protein n=1 Tax=Aquisphaera insulae TaxID=2712864 RepID=UPI0013ED98F4|nr:TolC family protein [Aquisphaera insulae]
MTPSTRRSVGLIAASVMLLVPSAAEAQEGQQRALPATEAPANARLQTGALPQALPDHEPLPALTTDAQPAAKAMEAPLVPGQAIQPIDLSSALRLAGARDLDIATARQQVLHALGELDEARGLWLPSLFTGPTYYRLDGQVQAIDGRIQTVHRDSLSLGSTATLANSFPAPPPGSGYPPLNSLSGVLRLSDALYGTRAVRRVIAANEAGVEVATNNSLLAVAETYFDLQLAAGSLAIAREAAGHAEVLEGLTGTFARSGAGLEADHRRARTELRLRSGAIRSAAGRFEVASAHLVRLLLLDPHVVVAPVEPAELVIRLIADDIPLDDLICQGWRSRPELARAKELVEASVLRLKQAKLRPFVPSLAVSYSGAGFGGGQNSTMANMGGRGDLAASLFWELRGLGLSDRGFRRTAEAQRQTADIDFVRVRAQVANDVVASYKERVAASGWMEEAKQSVTEANESLSLNETSIRRGGGLPGATRPIEVLQPIQALAQARADYLNAVLSYNRAQFRLYRALGRPPMSAGVSPPPAPDAAPAQNPGQ